MKRSSWRRLCAGLATLGTVTAGALMIGTGPSCLACTEVGCADSVGVTVRLPGSDWPDGSYRLDIDADGLRGSCTVLWSRPEEEGDDTSSSSGGDGDFYTGATCDQKDLFIFAQLGSRLDADGKAIPGQFQFEVSFDGTPENVTLSLSRDGTQLGKTHLSPVYEDSYPNGKACGPDCKEWGATWQL